MHRLLICSLLFLSAVSFVTAEDSPKNLQVFLLAGQSNMAGRGVPDEASAQAHPRVLTWSEEGKWAPATDPLHWDKRGAGVGPGKRFAEVVADADPTVTVALIPTACGGSPISAWEPGAYHDQTKSHPYDDCLARVKAAGAHGKIKAILWHQGESDSNPKLAPLYEAKMKALIERFRKEFGQPDLPVFIGQLGQFPDRPWSDAHKAVDAAQQRVAETVPHVYFISSEGLLSKGDNLHFSTEAARVLGERYAESYLKNEAGKPGSR
jgi:hypothetical protein